MFGDGERARVRDLQCYVEQRGLHPAACEKCCLEIVYGKSEMSVITLEIIEYLNISRAILWMSIKATALCIGAFCTLVMVIPAFLGSGNNLPRLENEEEAQEEANKKRKEKNGKNSEESYIQKQIADLNRDISTGSGDTTEKHSKLRGLYFKLDDIHA